MDINRLPGSRSFCIIIRCIEPSCIVPDISTDPSIVAGRVNAVPLRRGTLIIIIIM